MKVKTESRKRNLRKVLACGLSVAMAAGMAVSASAAEEYGEFTSTAPIYSTNGLLDVIVPTEYQVAFNPSQYAVKTGGDQGVTDAQVVTKSYGMVNLADSDMVVSVNLTVEDKNAAGDQGITFVDSISGDGYNIHLTAVPADTSEIKVISGDSLMPVSISSDGVSMNNVSMNRASGEGVTTLKAGANSIGFYLKAAKYNISGNGIDLETTKSNDISDQLSIDALADNGKGVTAFTFGGEVGNADWSKVKDGVGITAVYTAKTASEAGKTAADIVEGTGAKVELSESADEEEEKDNYVEAYSQAYKTAGYTWVSKDSENGFEGVTANTTDISVKIDGVEQVLKTGFWPKDTGWIAVGTGNLKGGEEILITIGEVTYRAVAVVS